MTPWDDKYVSKKRRFSRKKSYDIIIAIYFASVGIVTVNDSAELARIIHYARAFAKSTQYSRLSDNLA